VNVRALKLLLMAMIVLISACACALGGGGSPDRSPTTITFAGVREQGASGLVAAQLEGDLAEQGLELAPTWATTGAVILQGVVGGQFDVGNIGPAQLYTAIHNGACARVLRPMESAAYGLIARPEIHLDRSRPFPSILRQLKGKRIGVASLGAAQQLVLQTLLADAGLDPQADVTWVAIGSGATAVTAFTSDAVDVAMSYSQLEVNLQKADAGFDKVLDLSGPNTPLGVFWQALAVANCDWADAHPGVVMRLCHALNRGFESLSRDPDAGPRAFAYVNIGSDAEESASLWARYKTPVTEIPPLTEENWAYQARFAVDGYEPDFQRYVVPGCARA
jgi:NitT/TauT family transport system substrate-binding protein